MPKSRRGLILICLASLVTIAGVVYGRDGLSEVTPTIAVADEHFTESIRASVISTASGSWSPNREQVLAAVSLIKSDRGQRDIVAKALLIGWDMGPSLKRITDSRFQVFGLVTAEGKHLLIDATPLESDAPELWLTDCISCNVFDGGAAYWSVLIKIDSMEVTSAGRRP